MKTFLKKYGFVWLAMLLGGVFRAFVLMNLWNWFVTAVFHVSEISFLHVWGISLVFSLFARDSDRFVREEKRWNVLMRTLQHCVPEHNIESVKQEIEDNFGDKMTDAWVSIGGHLIGNAFLLGSGFAIHVLTPSQNYWKGKKINYPHPASNVTHRKAPRAEGPQRMSAVWQERRCEDSAPFASN
jgi:hypothetical protein